MRDIRGGLTDACEKAGIPYGRFQKDGFIFHDLRHTFNTYMRKAGIAESVIMDITGHSTREMFDRYNTVDAEDAKIAIQKFGDSSRARERIARRTANLGNIWVTMLEKTQPVQAFLIISHH